jgi:alpha-1,2-mannosyltransferase
LFISTILSILGKNFQAAHVKPIIKQLIFLFLLNLILAFLAKGITNYYGIKNNKMALDHAIWVFTDEIGNDSWRPMKLAYDYWAESKGQSLIYTDLLLPVKVKFLYPPTALLITQFIETNNINLLVFSTSATIMFLFLTTFGVIAATLYSYKEYKAPPLSIKEQIAVGIFLALLLFTFYPVVRAGTLGQMQVWLNAFFAIAILCYITGYDVLAGIMLGLMASIKPHYAVFILWGLLRGNKRLVIAITITGLLGVLLGMHEFGFSMYLDYLRGLSFVTQHGESYYTNQSFNALAGRIFSVKYPDLFNNLKWNGYRYPPYNIWVFSFTQIMSLAVLLIALIKTKSTKTESRLADFLLMGLGATLASPIAWEHHYGILFPIFICVWLILWFGDVPHGNNWAKIGFVLLYLIAANVFPFTKFVAGSYLNILQSYLLIAACGLFVILVFIKHRPDTKPGA